MVGAQFARTPASQVLVKPNGPGSKLAVWPACESNLMAINGGSIVVHRMSPPSPFSKRKM